MRLNPKNTKSMVASQSRIYAPGYHDVTLNGAELEEVKSLRILGMTFDSNLMFETHLRKVVSKKPLALVSCVGQESYLIAHMCSRAVSMHMFCSIVAQLYFVCGVSFKFAR